MYDTIVIVLQGSALHGVSQQGYDLYNSAEKIVIVTSIIGSYKEGTIVTVLQQYIIFILINFK